MPTETHKILIHVPPHAQHGDVIEIKALINHPMDNGLNTTTTAM